MAVTAITRLTKRPHSIASDGTNMYVGSGGNVYQVVIATAVKTILANVHPANITAMVKAEADDYLFVGDDRGQVTRVKVSDGVKVVMEKAVLSPVTAIGLKTTTLYIAYANGKLGSRSTTP